MWKTHKGVTVVRRLGRWPKRCAPPLQRSVTHLILLRDYPGLSLQKKSSVFLAGERGYAGAGALFALPTFPTCKFPELVMAIKI